MCPLAPCSAAGPAKGLKAGRQRGPKLLLPVSLGLNCLLKRGLEQHPYWAWDGGHEVVVCSPLSAQDGRAPSVRFWLGFCLASGPQIIIPMASIGSEVSLKDSFCFRFRLAGFAL